MKVSKAIEILNDLLNWQEVGPYPDTKGSIKLGIEALKAVHKIRHYPFPDEILQLPGETPEGEV